MFKKKTFDHFHGKFLQAIQQDPELMDELLWDVTRNFQENWDLEELDFAAMYDRSLESRISRRLWKGADYYPKEALSAFIRKDKEIVRVMFRDLFDEKRDVIGRVSRFDFHCKQLLDSHRKDLPDLLDHYHGDERMPGLYLSLRYPDLYVYPELERFRNCMIKLDARNVPTVIPLDTYFKMMRAIDKFLSADTHLMDAYQRRLEQFVHYEGKTLLPALDFIRWMERQSSQ